MDSFLTQKNIKIFHCENCDFSCYKESEWNRHVITRKHKMIDNDSEKTTEKIWKCKCGKIYKFDSGYYRHKKTCNGNISNDEKINNNNDEKINNNDEKIINNNEVQELKEIIKDLLKQNTELVQTIKEMTPKIGNTINSNNNSNNSNNSNNTFNLQLFLNETCKDAINLSDFIKTIQFTESDLENSRKNGGVSTLSNKMIKGLQELDVTKRPLHCTDVKRETLYIKEENKWEKDQNHEKIMDAFTDIAQKQREYVWEWSDANPDTQDVMHPLNDIFHLTNIKVLDPLTHSEEEGKKFIRNVARQVTIDKK